MPISLPALAAILGSQGVEEDPFDPLDPLAVAGGFWLSGGVGLTMGTGSDVNSWDPEGDVAGAFVSTGAPDKPTISTVGDLPSIAFAGGSVLDGQCFLSNQAASAFAFMHQVNGCTIFLLARTTNASSNQRIIDSNNAGNANNHGISLAFNGTTHQIIATVSNGSGTHYVSTNIDLDTFSLTQSNLNLFEFTQSQAAGYLLQVNGETAVTGSVTGSPSASNPSTTLAIGSHGALSTSYLFGDIVDLYVLRGVANAGTRNALRAYFAAKALIPLV